MTKEAKTPTCEEAGWTEEKSCSCGEVIVRSQPEEALGHALVDVPGKDATYTEPGYKAYKDCSRCDYTEGYEEIPVLSVPTGSISRKGCTIVLDGEIKITYYATITGFEGIDLATKGGMLVWENQKEVPTEATAVYGTQSYDQKGLTYSSAYSAYGQTTNGIAAKEYADELYMRVYVELPNGEYTYGPIQEYSVQDYAENQLGKPATAEKTKATCAAILHYGAAAQIKFGHNVEDLANANILETYPAAAWDESVLDELDSFTTSITQSSAVKTHGKTLELDGLIFAKYYFRWSGAAELAKKEMLVWKDVTGELTEENATDVKEMTWSTAYNAYCGQGNAFKAKEMGKTTFVCAKFTDVNGDVHYGEIVAYNPEAYAKNQLGKTSVAEDVKELCRRMVMYGEAARIQFGG